MSNGWTVLFHRVFKAEFAEFAEGVQDEILVSVGFLKFAGPQLGRPRVDTLKGSKHSNMKELRFKAAGGVWRVAFAFDPERRAVLLVAGNKSGTSEKRFYQRLIATADVRFDEYLATLRRDR
ncbi:type II toxin-antitoxin system RelE/ParE family toxin [Synechococcus sp. PCC 7336]|uniref:type II toxin-antitoxin system RelE/ParE family toxin n=1 Tax=Synechococcus sp. PCC 7336 TaxID=195250 RepID=UPI000371C211|nr:type II toxin-antitoxin system RelE/ParE family toxin [Synechococcus sp. PCC 7336]